MLLSEGGVGAAADAWGQKKVEKYQDKIDPKCDIFMPFIMEVQGGFGREAKNFMIELERRKLQRSCGTSKAPQSISNLELATTLSIELQRLNSGMILQRLPHDEALEVKERARLESAKHSAILAAKKGLNSRRAELQTNLKTVCPKQRNRNLSPTHGELFQDDVSNDVQEENLGRDNVQKSSKENIKST